MMKKIDIFCHIFPKPYYERMLAISGRGAYMQKRVREIPSMVDLDVRFRMMDQFEGYVQVPSLATPPIEALGDPQTAPELARLGNDGLAELVARHPDRFVGFVAGVPMNNPDAAVAEIDRAVTQLGASGIQMFSNVNGGPLDDPALAPIFERMAAHDLPIWIHPSRGPNFADYATESESKFELWWVFGWPYETSIAMARLVFAGYFDRFPNLKIITHHMGAMIPYFAGRIGPGLDQLGARTDKEDLTVHAKRLKRRVFDYFKMFYADTSLFGATDAIGCGLKFFGVDHVLFASDMPFDPEKGTQFIRDTIRDIESLGLPEADRRQIFEGNARRLLKLTARAAV
jgi:predicted TIM-barrel fold metal-dependent hydrolase